jgi:DNA-binding CsgD family transcriptional regulator
MGVRHAKKEELERLESKTLDAQFLAIVREGLGCSPFEAEAMLGAVKEVYFPFLDAAAGQAPPGKITLVAVEADEPAGKPVAACQKVTVCLSVHRGPEDDRILQEQGPAALRRARILELCQEALSQGGLLTAEDLAYRVFFVTPRTISRDLAALRQADPGVMIPMRSTVHDLGPVLTHRTEIVRLALAGKTTTQICTALRHSPRAVANYLSTFVRCVQLARKGLQVGQIAFLLRRGRKLVEAYLELLATCEQDRNYAYHLDELMRLGRVGGKKRTGGIRRG